MGTRSHRAALATLLAALPVLTGCFGFTYEEADIRSVLSGTVPSHSSRYRIPAPEIPILRRNIGIVREGGLFAMIVSPNLRGTVQAAAGRETEFGVLFRREPRRHLVLERVWVDGREVEVPGLDAFRYRLPDLVDLADIPYDEFPRDDGFPLLTPRDEKALHAAVGRAMYVRGFHVRRADLPPALLDSDLVRSVDCPPGKLVYFLTADGSDYLLCDHDPMTGLMLDYLVTENRAFDGGIRLAGVFEPDTRQETGISGMADVKWMELGGAMYFRSP